MSTLTNRALLLDEFFRLVNADITDDDMIEHDPSDGDGAYQLLGCTALSDRLRCRQPVGEDDECAHVHRHRSR